MNSCSYVILHKYALLSSHISELFQMRAVVKLFKRSIKYGYEINNTALRLNFTRIKSN